MPAADYEILPVPVPVPVPVPMQQRVIRFFDDTDTWLAAVIEAGSECGEPPFADSPRAAARTIISGLVGAMLVARTYGKVSRFSRPR